MFDVGLPELMVLVISALFIFGPDKLPEFAKQAGRMVRTVRKMAANARSELSSELGPEFANLDLNDLNPRALVKKHVLDVMDEDDDEMPVRPGHRPLLVGERPPYDPDST